MEINTEIAEVIITQSFIFLLNPAHEFVIKLHYSAKLNLDFGSGLYFVEGFKINYGSLLSTFTLLECNSMNNK